ncbi:MAG: hypothetical protein PVF17_13585, partial [Ignavibacteria bacterium]
MSNRIMQDFSITTMINRMIPIFEKVRKMLTAFSTSDNFSFKKYFLLILFFLITLLLLEVSAQSLGPRPIAQHSIGLKVDGTVYTWGYNYYGQLGDNTTTQSNTPVKVLKGAYSEGTTYLGDNVNNKITAVALGNVSSIAVTEDGIVYTWGHNYYGNLGDNTATQRNTPVKVLKGEYSGTTYLGDNASNPIIDVAMGYYFSIALASDGTVYSWGINSYGKLGDNTTTQRNTPVKVLKGEYSGTTYLGDNSSNKIISVRLGNLHSIALAEDGTVYTWGYNSYGALGDNTTTQRWTPVKVLKGEYSGTTYLGDNSNNKIIAVAVGQYHSIALAADGTVYTWGSNANGNLGDNTTTERWTPIKVLKGEYSGTTYLGDNGSNPIVSVAVGNHNAIALAEDGTVFTWGFNNYGQLGDGTEDTDRLTPIKVLKGDYSGTTYLGDNASNPITAASFGNMYSIALAEDGTVFTWGRNNLGQLGDNTTTQRNTPVKVNGIGGIGYLALPVELTSFKALQKGNAIILNWQTETESNNYGFDVERSQDNDWQKIGFVEGHGKSNSPKNYSFTD